MAATFIDQLHSQGFIVIAPVRICAANGTNALCVSGTVSTQDGQDLGAVVRRRRTRQCRAVSGRRHGHPLF